ncbi:MAG: hypothetical protein ACC656_15295 [Candidatus Heimdallarchaeota archaeon]
MSKTIYKIGIRPINSVEQFFNDISFNDFDDNCQKKLIDEVKERIVEIYSKTSQISDSKTFETFIIKMYDELEQFRKTGELNNYKIEESLVAVGDTKMIDIYLQPSGTIETIFLTVSLYKNNY